MKFNKKSGKKKAAAAAVVCFVAAIAITGTYTFNNYKESKSDNDLAMAEESDVTKEKYTVSSQEEVLDKAVDGNIVENEADTVEGDNNTTSEEMEQNESMSGDEEEKDLGTSSDITEEASISQAASVSFTKNSLILWPVSGTLLMDYSMDKTVYFKTLDQYKYNPAMIIGAAENDQIIAGASGLVKSIDNSAQTGTTVNIDLGNGYEAFYGQLQNVAVKTGDYVEAATTLGYVAEPTKYYSSEGTNLYFEMRKDGQPIDPKEYLTDYAE